MAGLTAAAVARMPAQAVTVAVSARTVALVTLVVAVVVVLALGVAARRRWFRS